MKALNGMLYSVPIGAFYNRDGRGQVGAGSIGIHEVGDLAAFPVFLRSGNALINDVLYNTNDSRYLSRT